jgi:hypothetical protein
MTTHRPTLKELELEIESHKNLEQAEFLSRFFKTGNMQKVIDSWEYEFQSKERLQKIIKI